MRSSYCSEKLEATTATGTAIESSPAPNVQIATSLPPGVRGNMSPYPTVVMVVMHHHSPLTIEVKADASPSAVDEPSG